MSRSLSSEDVTKITDLLSSERLSTFIDLTGSTEDAIELHQATMALGATLMSVTGVLEIALRNSVCDRLTVDFSANWLRGTPPPIALSSREIDAIKRAEKQAQRAAYSKMNSAEKQALDSLAFSGAPPANLPHYKVARKRQSIISVSDGQVISQITIYFWKSLFSDRYESKLWRRSLKKVFPNKTYSRALIAENLEVLYQIRNRLAHHEPVYGSRLSEFITSVEFITENLGSRFPSKETPTAKMAGPQLDKLYAETAVFRSTYDRLTRSP